MVLRCVIERETLILLLFHTSVNRPFEYYQRPQPGNADSVFPVQFPLKIEKMSKNFPHKID